DRLIRESISPKSKISNQQSEMKSFPLDRAGWFAGDVVTDAVDAFDFVADAARNAREQFVRKPDSVGSYAVLTFDDSKHHRIFVSALVAHHTDRLHGQQNCK